MSRDLGQLLVEGDKAVSDLIKEAFEAGRLEGAAEAKQAWKRRLASVLMDDDADELSASLDADTTDVAFEPRGSLPENASELIEQNGRRASPGSVKPRVAELVVNASNGMTAEEIAVRTGFKFNSVRGTLWTLGNERIVERKGNRWYAVRDPRQSTQTIPQPSIPDNEADWMDPFVGSQAQKPSPSENTEIAEHDSGQEHSATSVQGAFVRRL